MFFDALVFLFIWTIVSFFYFFYSLGPSTYKGEPNFIEIIILYPALVFFFVLGWAQDRNKKL